MSLSTWVQLLRNSFCVLKSLLPTSNFFQQPLFTDSSFYPLTVTTAIELPIAFTQFLAVIFNVMCGYTDISDGRHDINRTTSWLDALDRAFLADSCLSKGAEYLIIRKGLESDRSKSRTRVVVGIFELIFGFAFLFLVLNSLHIVGPTHPKPLIDALISMEIGLAYILVIMWRSFTGKVTCTRRLARLSLFMKEIKSPTSSILLSGVLGAGFEITDLFEALLLLDGSYVPKWRGRKQIGCVGDVCVMKPLSIIEEIQAEFKNVSISLSKLTTIDVTGKGSIVGASVVLSLRKQEYEAHLQAPLELLYFILNFIAGYGYLLGILAYYVPETISTTPLIFTDLLQATINGTSPPHSWCKLMMFCLSHNDADWYGNLAGDVAWTIEPVVMLLNTPYIKFFSDLHFTESQVSIESKTVKKNK